MPLAAPNSYDPADPAASSLPASSLGWLRLWFGLQGRVTRQAYVLSGIGLMLLKYVVEAAVVHGLSGLFYSPFDFVNPLISVRERYGQAMSPVVAIFWITWSLVFLWIAVSMSMRRALDAGRSPWHGFWMLVPLANLVAMLVLSCLRSRPRPKAIAPPPPFEPQPGGPLQAIELPRPEQDEAALVVATIGGVAVGACYAIVLIVGMTTLFHDYGLALFFGTPFVTGLATGYLLNRRIDHTGLMTASLATAAVILTGAGLLLFAVEGAICLAMAAPLMLPLGAAGGVFGKFIADLGGNQDRAVFGAVVLLPLVGGVESHLAGKHEFVVTSSIDIAAAPAEVWQQVIAFPEIEEEPEWFFQLGIAAPIGAQIQGVGIGATRECIFTTGRFVEPITVWAPPAHLAFDVREQPDPMTELSPFRHVHPPHLDGAFRATRGEFELIPLDDGRTRLIGRTWYTLDIRPLDYWTLWTDWLIHRIHLRVLRHIARRAEADAAKFQAADSARRIGDSPNPAG
jgi:uncharacterized membrane protein YhaH (DUF805 family)